MGGWISKRRANRRIKRVRKDWMIPSRLPDPPSDPDDKERPLRDASTPGRASEYRLVVMDPDSVDLAGTCSNPACASDLLDFYIERDGRGSLERCCSWFCTVSMTRPSPEK